MSYLNDNDKFDDFIDKGIRLMLCIVCIGIAIAIVGLNIMISSFIFIVTIIIKMLF